MKVDLIAMTYHSGEHTVTDSNIYTFSGKMAGICYMPHDFATLNAEPEEKSLKRAKMTKSNGHHSVFGHDHMTLSIQDAPKLFAMLLNNEHEFNTSEKSARYTKMELGETEQRLYDKWLKIIEDEITKKYAGEPYFDSKRIHKLAQENARYFTSVMTPTTFAYTTSYRQLNYLCGWMQKLKAEAEKGTVDDLYKLLFPTFDEFCEQVKSYNLLDEDLMNDGKNRTFTLIGRRVRGEEFGENYSINYQGSFAEYAQAQRHRTLNYEFMLDDETKRKFYVPKILISNDKLFNEWLSDMQVVAANLPQATLLNINERGSYENLILKAKERLCTAAQLEIMDQTRDTIKRYITETKNEDVKCELQAIDKGARCTFGVNCIQRCQFKDGINLSRDI